LIHWLQPSGDFPPVEHALQRPNGLLAAGGDLSPERLLRAYRLGIFPWFSAGEPILWWSPDPRVVLFPGDLRIARSMAKTLRKADFEVRADSAFEQVIQACSEPRSRQKGTWITAEMQTAYTRLHRLGVAHSIETWRCGELVGGLLVVVEVEDLVEPGYRLGPRRRHDRQLPPTLPAVVTTINRRWSCPKIQDLGIVRVKDDRPHHASLIWKGETLPLIPPIGAAIRTVLSTSIHNPRLAWMDGKRPYFNFVW
jgi:hypothetical protein